MNLIAPWKIVSTFWSIQNIQLCEAYVYHSISGSLREAAYACSKAALNKMVGDLARAPQPQNVDFCLIDPAGFLLIWEGPRQMILPPSYQVQFSQS